ncbi:hypothetical protein J3D47_000175 [Pseudomonas laurylsulfativorans]|nr:hypothetical protein [Pseudomonas laurylsulfativorans]
MDLLNVDESVAVLNDRRFIFAWRATWLSC